MVWRKIRSLEEPLTVLGVVVVHLAVATVFPVGLISPPVAVALEASAVAAAVVACVCVHGRAEVAIWIAYVLGDCCGGGLLLDGGYHLLDQGFGGSAHEDYDGHCELI